MDEIKDANDDIKIYKLVFIGSNKKKINFNTQNAIKFYLRYL